MYRQVHISFWQDEFVLQLTPEEKFFYLYLMTNSKTTQCGIYATSTKIIAFETGYNTETVTKLLEKFIEYKKIKFDPDTGEIMLLNWIRFNPISGIKIRKCVEKELLKIKCSEFLELFAATCEQQDSNDAPCQKNSRQLGTEKKEEKIKDTPCKGYAYPIDTPCIPHREEKEKEKEEEKEKTSFERIVKFYESNMGRVTPTIAADVQSWLGTTDADVVELAIREGVANNARSYAYIQAILRDWHNRGITTVQQVNQFNSSPVPSDDESPELADVCRHWVSEWKRIKHADAYITVKNKTMLQRLITRDDAATIKQIMTAYLIDSDSWHAHQGHQLALLESAYSTYATKLANRPKPNCPDCHGRGVVRIADDTMAICQCRTKPTTREEHK